MDRIKQFQAQSREQICVHDGKKTEIYNRVKLQAALINFGLVVIPLAYDSQGADFLLADFSGDQTFKVQLKSRITVSNKYADKQLYMAFPLDSHQPDRDWVIVDHDWLAQAWRKTQTAHYLSEHDDYTSPVVSQGLRSELATHSLVGQLIQL